MGRGLDGYFDIRALALCSFEGPREARSLPVSGGYGEGETPLPIPNRAVKPLRADGTWPERAWESRSPPVHSPPKPADLAEIGGLEAVKALVGLDACRQPRATMYRCSRFCATCAPTH